MPPLPPAGGVAAPIPPCQNKNYYLPMTDLMKAIQDEGVVDKKSPEGKFKFPKVRKFAKALWTKLKEHKGDVFLSQVDLPTNATRATDLISSGLLQLRKHMDKTDVYAQLAAFGKADSQKVYILKNDLEFYGLDMYLDHLFNYLGSKSNKKEEHRNGSDAIRVISIMLDPKYRETLHIYLKGTKTTRAECDQSTDPNIAWAIDCLEDYSDPDYLVAEPDDLLEEDWVLSVDPNDIDRISKERDSKWFLETWNKYVAPKYRKALKKWDTETGGGSHEANQFSLFCDSGDKWLTWVYLLDLRYGFILWCSATGAPPKCVGRESGFDNLSSPSDSSPISSIKKRKIEATSQLLLETKKTTEVIRDIATQISASITSKEEARSKKHPSDALMDELCRAQKQRELVSIAVQSMTPRSKLACETVIDNKIQYIGRQLKELHTPTADKSSDESDENEI